MIRGRVRHNGDEVARHLRRAKTKLRRGLAAVPPVVAGRSVAGARQRGASLGGVHRHVLPGVRVQGSSTIVLDGRREPAVFGAVYGGGRRPTTRQFPPYIGRSAEGGYMLIPDLRRQQARAERTVDSLLDEAF